MKIKKLTWLRRYNYLEAKTGFSSSYMIQTYWDDAVQLTLGSEILGTYKNNNPKGYKKAKAAAQADFEKRVMACFETTDKSNFWG